MAGLMHLFDFNQVNMAKNQNNHVGVAGFEAPRNSLDLPTESLQSYYSAEEYELNSYEERQSMSKSTSYSTETSMNKLINEEIARGLYNKHNMPSVVARLMGMDVFPSGAELFSEDPETNNEKPIVGDSKKQTTHKVPSTASSRKQSKRSREKKFCLSDKGSYAQLWSSGTRASKPLPRLHPQEQELQQFKKDFEAWQAARFLECARVVQLENIPEEWLAQLNLTKEKMAVYETARKTALEKAEAVKRDTEKSMSSKGSLQQGGLKMNTVPAKQKQTKRIQRKLPAKQIDPISYREKSMGRNLDDKHSRMEFDQNSDKASTPPRIVILKPAPDRNTSNNDSWVSSSSSPEDRTNNIEDLLEEVKERLKSELQGKTFWNGSTVSGGGIETPFKEKPLSPRQRPQQLTMQAREKFTGDHGTRLVQLESVRSYRSEIHAPEPSSPECMHRDIRKLLSERLGNVLNGEYHSDYRIISNSTFSPTFSEDTRGRLEQARNILDARSTWNDWNDCNNAHSPAKSFRNEFRDEERYRWELTSPRKLIRSLSAPLSETSFGKLLLEDRHVQSGAHIGRKHEFLESKGADARAQKKERLNFREKVSNIRQNLNITGKLFNRKLQSVDLSPKKEFDSMRNIMCGTTVVANFSDKNDNSTEVPPSPASVCSSSPREDLWKPLDHPSPISASDITSLGDQSVGSVFREISSNLNALRRQLHQLDDDGSEVTAATEEPFEAEVVDLENEAEAYVRDLLIASGLYEGLQDRSFSRWDPFVKHISDSVFEKVEESFYSKPDEVYSPEDYCEERLNRKVLFDMSNEALSRVLGPPLTLSKLTRKVMGDTVAPPSKGRKLLEKVWEIICYYMCPPLDNPFNSLDDMVAHDLDLTPWFNLMDEEVKIFGRELESNLTGELIVEVVKDLIKVVV